MFSSGIARKWSTSISRLSRGWSVYIKITPYGIRKGWSNIMHATIGGNNRNYGDRIPGIWFRPGSTRLHICSAVNGNKNKCYESSPLPLRKEATVVVRQIQSWKDFKYYYQIFINRKRVYSIQNKDTTVFKNVEYFLSDPWYVPANAKLGDFKIAILRDRSKFKKFKLYGTNLTQIYRKKRNSTDFYTNLFIKIKFIIRKKKNKQIHILPTK